MIGENIKKLREMRGIGQSEFAEMLNIKRQTLFKYEKNIITNVPIDRIEQMATILGVDPSAITGWEDKARDRYDMYFKLLTEKLSRLDDVDRAKIEERIDVLLESDKYQEGNQ